MKPLHSLFAAFLLAGATTQGALYSSGTLNTVIPDANPTGISSTLNVDGFGSDIGHVSVLINVSGGYNGDLTAYLSYNGTLVPLLSRVGTGSGDIIQQTYGFSTAGFSNVRLDDAGSLNIHDVATPESSPTSYKPDGGTLSSFTGNPNGNWTLFFADMASGGGSSPSTLGSWSLEITAVPEPVNVALGIFGGIFLVGFLARSRWAPHLLRRWWAAWVQWVDAV
jgi:subtilisin-like proprotein convertase family protein